MLKEPVSKRKHPIPNAQGKKLQRDVLIWALEVGSWALEVGRWKLGVGSWELGVGRWKLEVGSWELGVGSLADAEMRPVHFPIALTPHLR